ncbi:hypothetical protein [Bacillus fonticola]|uniref:hypothetical protein n=1 Tax=Bacillus fonticola TaxID=2728853 RepID=UPI0014727EBE|nr:hypothetical protein [Bacillus fonticola]
MKRLSKLEAILWSVALPGFAQLLTGQLVKGVLFVVLEVLINVQSQFNEGILLSFNGETEEAYALMDYQWLMFYPCLYMFAMWDAYRDAMPASEKLTFLPFAFGAYFITVGLMYSGSFTMGSVYPGPVFTPMLALIPGLSIGWLIRKIILFFSK